MRQILWKRWFWRKIIRDLLLYFAWMTSICGPSREIITALESKEIRLVDDIDSFVILPGNFIGLTSAVYFHRYCSDIEYWLYIGFAYILAISSYYFIIIVIIESKHYIQITCVTWHMKWQQFYSNTWHHDSLSVPTKNKFNSTHL